MHQTDFLNGPFADGTGLVGIAVQVGAMHEDHLAALREGYVGLNDISAITQGEIKSTASAFRHQTAVAALVGSNKRTGAVIAAQGFNRRSKSCHIFIVSFHHQIVDTGVWHWRRNQSMDR